MPITVAPDDYATQVRRVVTAGRWTTENFYSRLNEIPIPVDDGVLTKRAVRDVIAGAAAAFGAASINCDEDEEFGSTTTDDEDEGEGSILSRGGRFLDFLDIQPVATGSRCKMLF
jgi:hypothetical protein